MQPAGFYLGEEYHRAGGVPAVIGELMRHKRIHEGVMTVNGRTMGDNCRNAPKPDGAPKDRPGEKSKPGKFKPKKFKPKKPSAKT